MEVDIYISTSWMLASVLPTAAANPESANSKFSYCILMLSRFFFDTNRHAMISYVYYNIIGVLLYWKVKLLTCELLLLSHVPVSLAPKNPTFLQMNNFLHCCIVKLVLFISRRIGTVNR